MQMRDIIDLIEGAVSPVRLFHITSKAKFKLDPNFAPEDNSVSIEDRSGHKGIYLTPNVERWVNGHDYIRPFVAEIHADPEALKHDRIGRWGGEIFVPAEHFDKLKVHRVVPLDAIARETYGTHGWIEGSYGYEFDTGNPIPRNAPLYPFRGYTYPGDVRTMPAEEVKRIRQHFAAGHKARLRNR